MPAHLVGHNHRVHSPLCRLPVLLVNLHGQAAALHENFLQDPLQLRRPVPGYHRILQSQAHHVLTLKGTFRLTEHAVEKDAVIFKLHKDAVPVDHQEFFRRVLSGKAVFFLNLDGYPLAGEQLLPDPLFQPVNILFVNQPRTYNINANRASVPGGGDSLHLHQV